MSTQEPLIPMHPDDLPQQHVSEVVEIDPCPEGLIVQHDRVCEMPDDRPVRSPRATTFLCSVEWSYAGPKAYYLHQRGKRWLLWTRWFDDNFWEWNWNLTAYAPKVNGLDYDIGTHMLKQLWEMERDNESLDHFHFIADEGFLETKQIIAIAREVWITGQEPKEDPKKTIEAFLAR